MDSSTEDDSFVVVCIVVNLNLKWRTARSDWGIIPLPTYHLVELQSPEALQPWPSVVPLTAPGPFAASDIPSPGRPVDTASHISGPATILTQGSK